jgi:hypothetical protein
MDQRKCNGRNYETRSKSETMKTIENEIKMANDMITRDMQKLEGKAERRTLDSLRLLREEIKMIGKTQKDSEIEGNINEMLEMQQELQTTLNIDRKMEENQRERDQDREIGVITEIHETQSKIGK